ncbi:polysialyltransferase family glycosyltransferase [Thiomicrorhabdus cannonii]|uniref:polysialyltransferase family glycosyltransferase n=1 Tax=Thiomicrorhabdus cannonii TaxID=2748011 RepID=UPI0015B9595B|nr:polysialyltransferase family glycosyltransferase [Thiomicrorhabdus cannonii]
MRNELYFISSIFHLLIAALVLASRPDAKALLVFIRFDKKRYDALLPCCSGLVGSAEQLLFIEDGNKSAGQRKRNAKQILAFAESHQVERVFVGNDRHVEFQYVAYHLRKSFSQLRTAYLDEGLFSYIGRKASQSFADKWIDQTLKKLVYGAWWHTPPTIGASKYIDEAWLAYPDLACSVLQARPIVPLPLQGATSPRFQAFIGCWAGLYDLPAALDNVDYVLTITDEKNFSRFLDYSQSIRHLVEQLVAQGKTIAVKYHPNANGRDLLNLAAVSEQVMVLPSAMPFEVLLPLLSRATLIAEFSSTLLTSRLLMPNMTVWSIRHAQQTLPLEMQKLLEALAIESHSLDEICMKVGSA